MSAQHHALTSAVQCHALGCRLQARRACTVCSAAPCSWLAVSKEAGTTNAHARGHEKISSTRVSCPCRSTTSTSARDNKSVAGRRPAYLELRRLNRVTSQLRLAKLIQGVIKISRAPGQVVRATPRRSRRGPVPMRLAAGVRPACRQTSPVPLQCQVSLAILMPMHDISVRGIMSIWQVVRAGAPCLDERRCDKGGLGGAERHQHRVACFVSVSTCRRAKCLAAMCIRSTVSIGSMATARQTSRFRCSK